ncbi:LOW QUALITY PROTEIN: ninjurin-1 [Aulostomus maculatus]
MLGLTAPLHYANKKSAAESMLDVVLLLANASQLKAVLEQANFSFYKPITTLISISLCLTCPCCVLDMIENVTTGVVFIIVVVNIFITAYGIHRLKHSD